MSVLSFALHDLVYHPVLAMIAALVLALSLRDNADADCGLTAEAQARQATMNGDRST